MIALRIQSITGVITNSSSEVYMMLNGDAIDNIKAAVDSILKAGGSINTFDNLFTIEEEYYNYEDRYDDYIEKECEKSTNGKICSVRESIEALEKIPGVSRYKSEYTAAFNTLWNFIESELIREGCMSVEEFCQTYNETRDSDYAPIESGFVVKSKVPSFEGSAITLNKLNSLFTAAEYYNG